MDSCVSDCSLGAQFTERMWLWWTVIWDITCAHRNSAAIPLVTRFGFSELQYTYGLLYLNQGDRKSVCTSERNSDVTHTFMTFPYMLLLLYPITLSLYRVNKPLLGLGTSVIIIRAVPSNNKSSPAINETLPFRISCCTSNGNKCSSRDAQWGGVEIVRGSTGDEGV